MHPIRPTNPNTYERLLSDFEKEVALDLPKSMRGYIERTKQPPISAFLNVSLRNHQNIPTRVGHVSLSLMTPIQLDILAWHAERANNTTGLMETLRDALILDLVHVSDTRIHQHSSAESHQRTSVT